ncbi:MAG: type I pullulanase [Clostridia bacterium]|nr:type I pullulanase [Clostridia bacterium]
MKIKKFFSLICVLLCGIFVFASCKKDDNESEYTLEKQDGYNQVTIYYNRAEGYDKCDIWFWYDGVDGRGYEWHPCAYGAKFIANVPENITTVNFIIRTGCSDPCGTSWGTASKDGSESDRSIKITGKDTVVYTKSADPNTYMSNDGGKTLEIIKFVSLADLQTLTKVKVVVSDNSKLEKSDVKIKAADGTEANIVSVTDNVITLGTELDLSVAYTLEVTDMDPVGIVPMTYFSSAAFKNAYTYDGDLGVKLSENKTEFYLWAPTASEVKLNIFDNGSDGNAISTVAMEKGEKGSWKHIENNNLNGKYYTYTVTTSLGTNEAVDPYAVSAGVNGKRGMILDLSTTDPDGWTDEVYNNPQIENYTDAQIWEVHVRDFSNKITSSQYKGKYLAFTEEGLKENGVPVGLDYLKALGITHVHLLPSFDYASVDESKDGGFNWGYDPQNYNVPEGSYSTNPADGAVRVKEYKQMVQALHNNGISVVMDVVYNHTYSADSNLNRIVPYYYYRYGANGALSNGSGCGNETASERSMVRRYMRDSIHHWQTEYNLDGFRFDLMGVHDIETMQLIEKDVHKINPQALIYGEGWTGGTAGLDESNQAILKNLQKLNNGTSKTGLNGIAMFNDVIRDGLKGSVFDIDDTGFATGAKSSYLNKILFGVTGGCAIKNFGTNENGWYAENPTQVINYASAHDNNTLWDRICHVYGEENSTLDKRLAMNRLTAAIVQTSLGIPFMQAGEEMLRFKKNADGSYNENSYNANDDVNNIRWNLLKSDSNEYAMMQYYKGLIEFRKATPMLRLTTAGGIASLPAVCKLAAGSEGHGAFAAIEMSYRKYAGEKLLVIYNANETDVNYTLPSGTWNLYIDGTHAGTTALAQNQTGAQTIKALSCYVYKLAA